MMNKRNTADNIADIMVLEDDAAASEIIRRIEEYDAELAEMIEEKIK